MNTFLEIKRFILHNFSCVSETSMSSPKLRVENVTDQTRDPVKCSNSTRHKNQIFLS